MNLQPFTQAGFNNVQAELYALPNSALQIEADKIAIDFKTWMMEHFIFNDSQKMFLNHLNKHVIRFLASQTSIAVNNRIPIVLSKEEEEEEEDKTGKIIRPKSRFSGSTDKSGNFTLTGELVIEIQYQK